LNESDRTRTRSEDPRRRPSAAYHRDSDGRELVPAIRAILHAADVIDAFIAILANREVGQEACRCRRQRRRVSAESWRKSDGEIDVGVAHTHPQDYYVPARNKFKFRRMAPFQVIDDIVI